MLYIVLWTSYQFRKSTFAPKIEIFTFYLQRSHSLIYMHEMLLFIDVDVYLHDRRYSFARAKQTVDR